jgi:hypothetical protein
VLTHWGWPLSAAVPPPEKVTPGVLGFTVMFFLALATFVLIRSMVGHLRKVRYGPGGPDGPPLPDAGPDADAASTDQASATGQVEHE